MMRRFNALCACVVVALALGAVTASVASAKEKKPKKGLELKHEGKAVAGGTTLSALIAMEGCYQYTEGTLTSNDGKKADAASFSGAVTGECEHGSLSGHITSVSLSIKYKASYKGTLKLTQGECTYEFKKGDFSTPFEEETFGFEEATLEVAKGSAKTCKAKTTTLTAAVFDEGEALETEIT